MRSNGVEERYITGDAPDREKFQKCSAIILCHSKVSIGSSVVQIKVTFEFLAMGKEYHKRNWAMQLHYGCKRDNNRFRFDQLGPDTGYDCINKFTKELIFMPLTSLNFSR